MTNSLTDSQIRSKDRVTNHGEVYTSKREVNAMLDLVKQEAERIESRFLEPACGTGNFLSEVLERKLSVVNKRYSKSQLEYERYSIIAVSSVYGIDLLEDNVAECRARLFTIFNEKYEKLYRKTAKEACKKSIKYILKRNITWGDALTLNTLGENPGPIIFSEWSSVNGSMIKRRDFAFNELLSHETYRDMPLFSDLGEDVFVPSPVKEYPLTHFLEIGNACE